MPPKKDAPVKRPVPPPAKPGTKPAAVKPGPMAAKATAPGLHPAPEKPKEPPIDLSKVVVSEIQAKGQHPRKLLLHLGRMRVRGRRYQPGGVCPRNGPWSTITPQ